MILQLKVGVCVVSPVKGFIFFVSQATITGSLFVCSSKVNAIALSKALFGVCFCSALSMGFTASFVKKLSPLFIKEVINQVFVNIILSISVFPRNEVWLVMAFLSAACVVNFIALYQLIPQQSKEQSKEQSKVIDPHRPSFSSRLGLGIRPNKGIRVLPT